MCLFSLFASFLFLFFFFYNILGIVWPFECVLTFTEFNTYTRRAHTHTHTHCRRRRRRHHYHHHPFGPLSMPIQLNIRTFKWTHSTYMWGKMNEREIHYNVCTHTDLYLFVNQKIKSFFCFWPYHPKRQRKKLSELYTYFIYFNILTKKWKKFKKHKIDSHNWVFFFYI